jgi:hypothetical protein
MGNAVSDDGVTDIDDEFIEEAIGSGFTKEQAVQHVRLFNTLFSSGETTFEV